MAFGENFEPQNENIEAVAAPVIENQAPTGTETTEAVVTPVENQEAPVIATEQVIAPTEFKDEHFLSYAKEKYGKEFKSVDEIFADKAPVEKIVNPYEDVLDDEDRQYLDFKKETGRSRKDFEYLNTDFAKVSSLELARERVRVETGDANLSDETLDRYLANELKIDLSDVSEIDELDLIKLNGFAKPIRDQKIADKEKYRRPITPKTPESQADIVQLDNGSTMKKADYERLVNDHQAHIEKVKTTVNSVAAASFKVVIDDNGTQVEKVVSYDLSPDEKQRMFSIASDPSAAAEKLFRTEKGFDYEAYNLAMLRMDPAQWEKMQSSAYHRGRAEMAEEFAKLEGNINFTNGSLQRSGTPTKVVPIPGTENRMGFPTTFLKP